MNAKEVAAIAAVELVEQGMIVGLGTGSTASFAIRHLGEKVKQGLVVKAVASSLASETLALASGIPIIGFDKVDDIDLYIDGADEVDSNLNLIKGGGGALLREKILTYNSEAFIVIVDESKMVKRLGKFPLAIEITPFAADLTIQNLQSLECKPVIRKKGDKNYVTDNGNLIADCQFEKIEDPQEMELALRMIPGVVENGLFPSFFVHTVIVGSESGKVRMLQPE